jgi:hypothetical protein
VTTASGPGVCEIIKCEDESIGFYFSQRMLESYGDGHAMQGNFTIQRPRLSRRSLGDRFFHVARNVIGEERSRDSSRLHDTTRHPQVHQHPT